LCLHRARRRRAPEALPRVPLRGFPHGAGAVDAGVVRLPRPRVRVRNAASRRPGAAIRDEVQRTLVSTPPGQQPTVSFGPDGGAARRGRAHVRPACGTVRLPSAAAVNVRRFPAPDTFMKQILQSYRNGNLWLADVPEPRCSENAVRIRVEASVVSAGTEKRMLDLAKSSLLQKALKRPDQVQRAIQKVRAEGIAATWQQVNAKLDTPVPLGYSLCGTVVETGVRASAFQVGQRVAAAGAGHASHAQVVSVPMTLVARVPDDLSPEEAAFGTVGAIAMQAVRQAEVSVGEYVGVIGLGLLGNLVVQICRAAGARVAGTDIDPGKRDLALRLGAERTGADIQAVAAELTGGRGLDKVIIAAGSRD